MYKTNVVPMRGLNAMMTASRERLGDPVGGHAMGQACEKYAVDLSAYFDGELEGEELAELEAHLTECEACRASLEQMGAISSAMHTIASPPRRRGSILDALREKLDETAS